MGPRITVCRKGDEIYLTLKGDLTVDSSPQLLGAFRNLLMMSLQYTTAGSRVIVSLKTRGKIDLKNLAPLQQVANAPGYCEPMHGEARAPVENHLAQASGDSPPQRKPRARLTLIKGARSSRS
jgi:hypothetical protein